MRSFPVLVLLGGIVCSFHGVLPMELSGSGTLFSVTAQNLGNGVQALKLFFGPLGYLRSMQVKIEGEWSSRYGSPGGRENLITLYDGESIIKISGQNGICIRYLVVETDHGRIFQFGKPVGTKFEESPPNEDMMLSGIHGLYGAICIKRLAFQWSDIVYETSTTSEVTSTTQ